MNPAFLLVIALTADASAPPPTPQPGRVLLIEGGRFHGSGIVWERGRVLTALHVVEEMPAITVLLPGGEHRTARVVDRDPALDLALLAVEGDLGAALPLGTSADLARGESVEFAGCPARTCGDAVAVVLEASRAFAGARYLALSARVRPGASGGPVVDVHGALVGIVDLALRREGEVALAVPIERAVARFPRAALASSR